MKPGMHGESMWDPRKPGTLLDLWCSGDEEAVMHRNPSQETE